jgi:hypothetical protein
MLSLLVVFILFLILFGFIGSARGWAKELLVIFSVVLALAIIFIIESLVPVLRDFLKANSTAQFWVRTFIVLGMTFFGYQSPKVPRFSAKAAQKQERIQDYLLGFFMGLLSGYFVVGTLWSFGDYAGYPLFRDQMVAPPANIAENIERVLRLLPPVWLSSPVIVIVATVFAFVFVLIVFV